MICSEVLNGVSGSINGIAKFNAGRDFNIVSVSFDTRDTPEAAMKQRKRFSQRYHRAGSENGWHFLTGQQAQIQSLASALGFRYAWDPEVQQFAHASSIMLLTPAGHIQHSSHGTAYAHR